MKKRMISMILSVCMLASILSLFPADTLVSTSSEASASTASPGYAYVDLTQENPASVNMQVGRWMRYANTTYQYGKAPDGSDCWVMSYTDTPGVYNAWALHLDDAFFEEYTAGQSVTVEVECYDNNTTYLTTQYSNDTDNTKNKLADASETVTPDTNATNGWYTYTATLSRGVPKDGQNTLASNTSWALHTHDRSTFASAVASSLTYDILLETHANYKYSTDAVYVKSIKVYAGNHTCVSSDSDGHCDICGKRIACTGEHVYGDDHRCDNCGKLLYAEIDLTQENLPANADMEFGIYKRKQDTTTTSFSFAYDATMSAWNFSTPGASNYSHILAIKLHEDFFVDYNGEAVRIAIEYYDGDNAGLSVPYYYNKNTTLVSHLDHSVSKNTGTWKTFTSTLAQGLGDSASIAEPNFESKWGVTTEHIHLHNYGSITNDYPDNVYIRSIRVYLAEHDQIDNDKDYHCDLCQEWMTYPEHRHIDDDTDNCCDICGYVMSATIDLTTPNPSSEAISIGYWAHPTDSRFYYSSNGYWVIDTGNADYPFALYATLTEDFVCGEPIVMEVEYYHTASTKLYTQYFDYANAKLTTAEEYVDQYTATSNTWSTYKVSLSNGVTMTPPAANANAVGVFPASNSFKGQILLQTCTPTYARATDKIWIRSIKLYVAQEPEVMYSNELPTLAVTDRKITVPVSEEPVYVEICTHSDGDSNDYCDYCGKLLSPATLSKVSLSLNGDIGVHLYIDLDDAVAADSAAYFQVILPNGSSRKIMVSEAVKGTPVNCTGLYYKITGLVAAKEMKDKVAVELYWGNGTMAKTMTCSVADYAAVALENGDEKLKSLMTAMLNYGSAAQMQFDYDTQNLVEPNYASELSDPGDLSASAGSIAGSVDGLSHKSFSCILETTTTIRHYFTLTEGSINDFTFFMDGKEVQPTSAGNNVYYVDVENIVAKNIDGAHTLKIFKGGKAMTVTCSVYSYMHTAMNDTNAREDTDLMNVFKALYGYNQAAKSYFGTNDGTAPGMEPGETRIIGTSLLKKNKSISFSADITAFGQLKISHSDGQYGSGDIVITDTSIDIYQSNTKSMSIDHGLTLKDRIDITISVDHVSKLSITVSSGGQSFTQNTICHFEGRGEIKAESIDSSLTNVSFYWDSPDFDKDIWIMGDSYVSISVSGIRWPDYLLAKKDNFALFGFAGATSAPLYEDYLESLKQGRPKYAIWCLGMNDEDSSTAINASWKTYVEQFLAICEENDITPILATIPNVPSRSHTYKNEYVRNSGCRYIDFATAVSATEAGSSWTSGMLSADKVHPTALGAEALANRILIDVPELQ